MDFTSSTIRNPMVFILVLLSMVSIYSQESYVKLPIAKKDCPTFLLNGDIIVNKDVLLVDKEQIEELSVLYDATNRKEQAFYNLTEYGLVFIKLKDKLNSKSQSEIKEFFGFDSKNKIYIDGFLLENPAYKIATSSIISIEIIEPNSENNLKSQALNVWTLSIQERSNGCSKSDFE